MFDRVNARDFISVWRRREAIKGDRRGRNIDNAALLLDVEVLVPIRIGANNVV